MEYTKEENIETQILEAVKEVLGFNDPNVIKASIILRRIRTILGLKDLTSAPDLYKALKGLHPCQRPIKGAEVCFEWAISEKEMKTIREALAKAEGK